MNDEIEARGSQSAPNSVDRQKACEEEDEYAQGGANDRRIIQQKGDGSPKDRVANPSKLHHASRREAHGEVHHRDRRQIGGNIAFDLLPDVYGLSFFAETRQNLDEPPQKTVARQEQEIEKGNLTMFMVRKLLN